MDNIVIAMPKIEDANRIADIIKRSDIWEEPITSTSAADTLRIVEDREASVVICSKKLKDMGYEELSSYLPSRINMILLTQDASIVPFSSNIVRLLIPFRAGDLINTINMLNPGVLFRPKPSKYKRTAEQQRIIDEAKELLMVRNNMTEPEAFRYIQKNSMDYSRSLIESAQMILAMNSE